METTVARINLSPRAREELAGLGAGKDPFLRLWVTEGGCKGKSWQAALDHDRSPSDTLLWEDEGLAVLGDADSLPWLEGLSIDFSDDLAQGGFRFSSPKAASSCGCGSSFCG